MNKNFLRHFFFPNFSRCLKNTTQYDFYKNEKNHKFTNRKEDYK